MGEPLRSRQCLVLRVGAEPTFVSTNLLMVARMSWCPDTSSRVSGRYFSTLEVHLDIAMDMNRVLLTMASCLLLPQADWPRFSCLWNWCCQN